MSRLSVETGHSFSRTGRVSSTYSSVLELDLGLHPSLPPLPTRPRHRRVPSTPLLLFLPSPIPVPSTLSLPSPSSTSRGLRTRPLPQRRPLRTASGERAGRRNVGTSLPALTPPSGLERSGKTRRKVMAAAFRGKSPRHRVDVSDSDPVPAPMSLPAQTTKTSRSGRGGRVL